MKIFRNIIILCIMMLSVTMTGYGIFKRSSKSKKEVYINFLDATHKNEMNVFWDSYSKTFFDGKKNAKTPNEKEISDFLRNSGKTVEFYNKNIEEVESVINKSPKREKLDMAVRNYINFLKEERKAMIELIDFYKNGFHKDENNFQKENDLHVNYLNVSQKGKNVFEIFATEVQKFENGEK